MPNLSQNRDKMKPYKFLILIIFLFAISNAKVVAPKIYSHQDMGDYTQKQLTYAISVDCDAKLINFTTLDEKIKPVANVSYYLQYLDYSKALLAANKTNANGFGQVKLPGETKYLRGLFVLLIQKTGYKSKEIDFAINGCYSNVTDPQLDEELIRIARYKENLTRANITNNSRIFNYTEISNVTNTTPIGLPKPLEIKPNSRMNSEKIFSILFPIVYKFFGNRIFV